MVSKFLQATGSALASRDASKVACGRDGPRKVAGATEEMLSQRNVESVLFRGKKLAEQTNAEKLEWFAHELIKEHDRRKSAPLTPVLLKQPITPTATPLTSTPLTPQALTPRSLTPVLSPQTVSTATATAAIPPLINNSPPSATAPAKSKKALTQSPSYSVLVGQMLTTIL